MKNLLIIALAILISCPSFAQGFGGTKAPEVSPGTTAPPGAVPAGPTEHLVNFDLDFSGGTPGDLVRAIEKASSRPLNAIVPTENADVQLPPLKMKSVDVSELFQALGLASQTRVIYTTAAGYETGGVQRRQAQSAVVSFGFRTQGPPRDSSIWYFYHEKPLIPEEAKTCRFWQLTPYLETYKIEDITTAVQTGYKMLGEPSPTINFHKDTKLLIAVGEASKLNLIDSALRELEPAKTAAKESSISTKSAQPNKP